MKKGNVHYLRRHPDEVPQDGATRHRAAHRPPPTQRPFLERIGTSAFLLLFSLLGEAIAAVEELKSKGRGDV